VLAKVQGDDVTRESFLEALNASTGIDSKLIPDEINWWQDVPRQPPASAKILEVEGEGFTVVSDWITIES
jgi:hypothetical protein